MLAKTDYICEKTNKKMATLRKSSNKMLAGVAAGYAEYFGLDVTLMRIIFVVATICGFMGGIVYLISWILMPE